ncbi:MAG: Enoyl-CoA hydratase/carnithine racemase [Chloroflexi bacterium]|nr:MAG: Enoyl-CoA hydratase/carnithine racemase [Chloroflexota bacterium]
MNTLNVRDEGAVRVVQLDRPDALNAFSIELMDELSDAFLAAAEEASVRVLLLTGAGRAFSAGADLKGNPDYVPRHALPGLLKAIIDFPKPFIVAVNGLGVGIGATICGLADLVYIAEGARLRAPFSALGLTAEAASTVTFPAQMGRQRANWFLLSAEWMSAREVVDAGLALEVLPGEALLPRAMAQAAKLAALPPASLLATKSLIMQPLRAQMKASYAEENVQMAALRGQPANVEAITAFREKREPDFSSF